MEILTAEQVREWDRFTIKHEPITSVDLMERAARACTNWLVQQSFKPKAIRIFCGKGNNGGDGLAIGRMLLLEGYAVSVYILEFGKQGSDDFQANLQRLHKLGITAIHFLQEESHFPRIEQNDLLVDALYGSGLNKPLEGLAAALVHHLNAAGASIVSIDLPSGLFMDKSSKGNVAVTAAHTLSFECYKTALLVQENAAHLGEVHILPIGLHRDFLQSLPPTPQLLDEQKIRQIFRPRNRFAHKGSFGQALLVGGSWGKMGAMVLATKACLAAGAGLTTAFIPRCGYTVLQATAPEAMTLTGDGEEYLGTLPDDVERFSAIGIGPGMGTHAETQKLLSFFVRRYRRPVVIDADGLNILSLNKELANQLPPGSILTPHPKEFDRLFGDHASDFDRLQTAREKAAALNVIIILKGHHSFLATPEGDFFNSTGNAGMAKGGSGDVLTGILTALLVQGYPPAEAAQLGVYLHGWAGDLAAQKFSMEVMLPSHLIDCLGEVFLLLNKKARL
ncbi:NAD(P)H-hydrate dehydratase [Flavisolibacter sp. BT320]|nr:NAD(P)H-hydrate dehydratase [Flavisolibacter longurius]